MSASTLGRLAGRAAVVLALAAGATLWARNVARVVRSSRSLPLSATPREALAAVEGERYAAEIERIRKAIPPQGSYAIVGSIDRDATKWLRYELAPRKPWYAGDRDARRWVFRAGVAPAEAPRWTVLAGQPGEPPELVPTSSLAAHGLPPDAKLEDRDIPGWLDEPAPDATVKGTLAFRGWCQEPGARPCATVAAFVDGHAVAVPVTRVARPDVEKAIPTLGSCARAGFEILAPAPRPGEHEVTVLFLAESGRWRRIGPRRFRWIP